MVAAAVRLLDGEEARALGFFLNPKKSRIIWLREELMRANFLPEYAETPRVHTDFKLLGNPFGSDKFVVEVVQESMDDVAKVWKELEVLDDAQVAFTLLRACAGWSKVADLRHTTLHAPAAYVASVTFLRGNG